MSHQAYGKRYVHLSRRDRTSTSQPIELSGGKTDPRHGWRLPVVARRAIAAAIARGPRHPSRLIFVSVAFVGSAIGIVTGDFRLFFLAVILSTILLCSGYALIRRRLGWQPLNFDYLFELLRILSPC
jgi:hypothetical protein